MIIRTWVQIINFFTTKYELTSNSCVCIDHSLKWLDKKLITFIKCDLYFPTSSGLMLVKGMAFKNDVETGLLTPYLPNDIIMLQNYDLVINLMTLISELFGDCLDLS